jgi:hypothetical protein
MKKLTQYAPNHSKYDAERQTADLLGQIIKMFMLYVPYMLVKNWRDDFDLNDLRLRLLKALDPHWKIVYQKSCAHYDGNYWSSMYNAFFGKEEVYGFNVEQVAHRIPKDVKCTLFCIPPLTVNLQTLFSIVEKQFYIGTTIIAPSFAGMSNNLRPIDLQNNIIGSSCPEGYLILKDESDEQRIEEMTDPCKFYERGLTVYMALLICLHYRYTEMQNTFKFVCSGNRLNYHGKVCVPVVVYSKDAVAVNLVEHEKLQSTDESDLYFPSWTNITEHGVTIATM